MEQGSHQSGSGIYRDPIHKVAMKRYRGVGHKNYGLYDPETDTRCLPKEMQEEAADLVVYDYMYELKYPGHRKITRWCMIQAMRFVWWCTQKLKES